MREQPPQSLVDLLGRLGLTAPERVRGAGRYAGRLARDLPLFESVWVDALAHAGAITPFQAAEINAGRGEALKVGPYVLCRPLEPAALGATYLAREIDSGQMVRLVVLRLAGAAAADLQSQLESLVAASAELESENLAPAIRAGTDENRVWAASRVVHGQTTTDWMVRDGRFPPQVVVEIARQMLAGLTRLESAGIVDGDLGAERVILAADGNVVIPLSGLRGIVRPEEGYARADLQPEAYDYLAPERIVDGTPPTIASDIYACGCLWWHLLAGRPPLAGGNSLGKLRAAHAAKIVDVRRLAPETPEFLATAIAACTQPAVGQRPRSMSEIAAMLGASTAEGRAELARLVAGRGRLTLPSRLAKGKISHASWIAVGIVLLVAVTLPAWFSRLPFGAPRAATQGAEETAGQPETSRAKASGASAQTPEATGKTPTPPRKPATDPLVPENGVADIVLPGGIQTEANALKLRAGQRVCGAAGSRATIRLPAGGWVVGCENVRFENIDFVASDSPTPPGGKETGAAMIVLEACRAEFRGCSFQGASSPAASRTAIVWTEAAGRHASELSLPTGQLDLTDCVLRGVAAGVDSRKPGALFLRFENTLHLGPGPLVRLGRAPTADQPVTFLLRRFTLRDAAALVQCRYEPVEDSPGKIAVQASDSAFVPGGGGCLVALVGRDRPERLVQRFEWTGQGSIVSPDAVLVGWQGADGPLEAVDEQALAVAGLVRSKVTFAGPAGGQASASRIVRWQAPLRSADAPGIDETLGVSAPTVEAADNGGGTDGRRRKNQQPAP